MKPRVLIVDDSLTVRMDIGEALQSAGFDTVLCADLRSAREALAREGSVLIVLDILLPDGDGLDFLKELRSSPATAQIPVLLLSTEADAKNRVREMGAGADEYIGKPYDLGLVVARARALTQADASGGVGLGRRVLVIDDSVTFRDELRQSLEGAGYHVREAATGEEGLALAAADRPDAVVVDGILPGIDGATVVRRLKSDTALRSTRCLLLTGAEGTNDGLRALEAGADAYVRKSEDLGVILVR
ncbi:MAG TPA: response regulator, partial [Candidatus Limnocylindrales bacterium]